MAENLLFKSTCNTRRISPYPLPILPSEMVEGIAPKKAPQSLHSRVSISKIMNQMQNLIVQSETVILKICFDVKQSFGMLLCKFLLVALTSKKQLSIEAVY